MILPLICRSSSMGSFINNVNNQGQGGGSGVNQMLTILHNIVYEWPQTKTENMIGREIPTIVFTIYLHNYIKRQKQGIY